MASVRESAALLRQTGDSLDEALADLSEAAARVHDECMRLGLNSLASAAAHGASCILSATAGLIDHNELQKVMATVSNQARKKA